ncbi:TPA: GNAT family N-acetyltransferase [Serratia liquefaciens]
MKKSISGWTSSDFITYREAYSRFGGSVCSHPDVIHFLSERGTAPEFYVYKKDEEVICATFASGKHLHVDCASYPFVFDDVIIPIKKSEVKFFLPFRTKQLSPYHDGDFYNGIFWKGLKRKTCVVKDEFSNSSHKKRRQAFQKFVKAGGECRSIDTFSNDELCDIYRTLFMQRWGETLSCFSREALSEVFGELRHLVFGYVLMMHGWPCAYDLVFKAECREWIFFDCINGGYDPAYADLSVGSILMYMNIQRAREICQSNNTKMTFSLGMDNPRWGYKKQWCNTFTLGRSLTL